MDVVRESLLKASAFTLIMVLLGVFVGLQMDNLRQDHLSQELRQSNLETETFVALQSYIEGSENYCELMQVRVPDINRRSAELGSKLTQLEGQNLGNDTEYDYIRDRYYNNQIRLYSALKKYEGQCGVNQTKVLFFFDESIDSQRQGEVLNELVQETNISIFSFNSELERPEVGKSPVVEVLKADYNVTEAPTLIVNDERKLEGFISKRELQNEVLQ
ncbi:MAG: hypothetical protein ACLFTA_03410 [Candidatus Nanohaloarchaea archaeon]